MKLLFLVIPDSDQESIPWGGGTSPVGASLVGALGRSRAPIPSPLMGEG